MSVLGDFGQGIYNAVSSIANSNKTSGWNYSDWRANVEAYKGSKGLSDEDKAFLYNTSLASWQNDLALHNWNLENQYNSPEQQMQRYLAAGLNPNLIYGAGASSGNAGNIGTPTVGGSFSPTDLAANRNSRMNAETSRFNARMNAAATALSMLGSASNLFEKLMTIRGEIDAQNTVNQQKVSNASFLRDYYDNLSSIGGASRRADAALSGYIREDAENFLKTGIARYQTDTNPPFVWENSYVNGVQQRKPIYEQLLDNSLKKTQNELVYQGFQNALQQVLSTVASNPIYGNAAQAQARLRMLNQQITNAGIDELIKQQIKSSYEWQNKISERTYNWMPWKNIGDIVSSFWPKFSFGFGKGSFRGSSGGGTRSTPSWFNDDYPYNF